MFPEWGYSVHLILESTPETLHRRTASPCAAVVPRHPSFRRTAQGPVAGACAPRAHHHNNAWPTTITTTAGSRVKICRAHAFTPRLVPSALRHLSYAQPHRVT